jgi:peptidoglycan/xylan/chitin deacetylase (PgdA/CDA1 family)
MARRVLDGGHELGNHTWSCGDLNAMGPEDAGAEIEDCAEVLRGLTGSVGRWFRPSRARLASPLVVSIARQAGYSHLLSYDVDPLESPAAPAPSPGPTGKSRPARSARPPRKDADPAPVRAAVARQTWPGSVVALRPDHPGTAAAFPAILADLTARGLRPVTASELLI